MRKDKKMSTIRTQDFWSAVVSTIIFGLLVTTFFVLINIYVIDEKKEVGSSYTKEAVTAFPEELTKESKDHIKGTSVLAEVLSYPHGTYIKINGTVVSDLIVSSLDMDYVAYSKRYGTDLLENYISVRGNYKKELTLTENGEVSGVIYTLVY